MNSAQGVGRTVIFVTGPEIFVTLAHGRSPWVSPQASTGFHISSTEPGIGIGTRREK